ncbi:MAG: tRNA (adenosine(37)-N6)-dimethylallyltransferase MiaA [Omnitrophica WOR_2 bacterium RIFCSPHIGHO2_01_FULL_48_9]|nr:MAG: tRNA (adenosine(37)-N6)-dimethylallyltransferase MiaA [Omnitrophica WOR_2 bacterium RIFCSPHIGHO2_02_FULL_48_11]OGX29863.1 MAG: tRNA (adenosine(37)-N6)-dimethylallyltransferase MiaA [Omnitrophica WOR_2 bacterium RIFCSPHIGHO2_01_FULL_48_9]
MSLKIIFIVGPTAVGKTEVAIALAERLKGEIVSCDSMQVYKEVSIASSKPTKEQLKKVPHHLIGIVPVKNNFDVAAFNCRALATIKKIQKRNKVPIVTGGSGMYMQVLLDGIFAGEKKAPVRPQAWQKDAESCGSEVLYQRLQAVDPQAAAKIHPHDTRRIMRALEVFFTQGKPISELQKKRKGLWGSGQEISIFALNREREELYKRIEQRVDQMFIYGIVEEMRGLLSKKLSKTAQGMIGLKEVGGFLKGEHDLQRAQYLLKRNTRHFAKRQLTWFRKDKRLQWINVEENDRVEEIVKAISLQLSAFSKSF